VVGFPILANVAAGLTAVPSAGSGRYIQLCFQFDSSVAHCNTPFGYEFRNLKGALRGCVIKLPRKLIFSGEEFVGGLIGGGDEIELEEHIVLHGFDGPGKGNGYAVVGVEDVQTGQAL
jgi:hypothetical protein